VMVNIKGKQLALRYSKM